MILIAATAIGLAVVRNSSNTVSYISMPGVTPRLGGWDLVWLFCLNTFGAAPPLVAFWSLALVIIRLRKPRPSLRRLARQPGFIACVAAVLGILLGALIAVPFLLDGLGYDDWGLLAAFPIGHAVAASWLTLVLNRRWRPVPDLFDRAGRVFGVFWIFTLPFILLTEFGYI